MLIVPMDRNVLGTLNLGDILSQRESIAREMQVLSQPRVVPDREILNTKMGNTYVRMRNTFANMAFKTTHNKDESLPQFMKSPQLIFSHN